LFAPPIYLMAAAAIPAIMVLTMRATAKFLLTRCGARFARAGRGGYCRTRGIIVAVKQTPLIAQYLSVKQRVPDAILFFRLGDFYEMFFEDAEVGARVLDIQLTSRSKDGVPLCGVPYHAAEPYIAKLVKAGHKVAICEQGAQEIRADGKPRGIMARQIVRVITPGTVGEETVLVAGEKNYLAAIVREDAKIDLTPDPFPQGTGNRTAGAREEVVSDRMAEQRPDPRGAAPRRPLPEGEGLSSGKWPGHALPEGDGKAQSVSGGYAVAAIEVSTGEFIAARIASRHALAEELARLAPREIVYFASDPELKALLEDYGAPVTALEPESDAAGGPRALLIARFGEHAIAGLEPPLARAAGAALGYLEKNFGRDLAHLTPPAVYQSAAYMMVDETTRRHLELAASSDGARRGSLLSILDETITAAGARTLANWIVYPLQAPQAISDRHDAVTELFEADLGGLVADALKRIGDLERLAGRLGAMRASPRDCLRLSQALAAAAMLRGWMGGRQSALIRDLAARIAPDPALPALIDKTLGDEPPVNPRDGNLIRAGFNAEVDELRALSSGAREVLARLEVSERERTGIASLKVRYNNVFGYYIEITKAQLERVPPDYSRKQTVAGGERFTTPALGELERKILSAESGLKELELQLFSKLLRDLQAHSAAILSAARAIGNFDALASLAKVARRRGYVRPAMNSSRRIRIRDGRHPVLEAGMRAGEFVPNDLDADPDTRQLLLITGPNMAGKSTYLRQVALIVIMAHLGSFVPATEASIGIVDSVMTRIGARDELRRGESTFMVEMRETARLLGGLTDRSLLLLDEVGRGTSTFDGLAIAWAVAEYLHDSARAKVLFATHFHELTDLARERPRVKNLSMAVREWGGEVLFLRRVIEEPASRSYGIEVARIAGLPDSIIARAREILSNLEQGELDEAGGVRLAHERGADRPAPQLGLFAPVESRIADELRALEIDRLTPVEALNLLATMRTRLKKDGT
jgi:DNA mismatch repair protein MutS